MSHTPNLHTINNTLLDVWATLELIARMAEAIGGGDVTITGDALSITLQKQCDSLMAVRNDLDSLMLSHH